MKKFAAFVLALAVSSAAFAQTVATVNGTPIDGKRIESLARTLAQDSQMMMDNDEDGFRRVLEWAIDAEPYRQEALKMGLAPDGETVADLSAQGGTAALRYKELDWPREQLLKLRAARCNPSEQEIRTFYNAASAAAKQAKIKGAQQYLYNEIVLKTKKQADLALKEIRSGQPFDQVMLNRSVDPAKNAAANGGLKTTAVAQSDGPWSALAWMQPGAVSAEPIYDYDARDYHIYLLQGAQPMRIPTLTESRGGIVKFVKNHMAWIQLDKLAAQAKIECDDPNIQKTFKEIRETQRSSLMRAAQFAYDCLWQ